MYTIISTDECVWCTKAKTYLGAYGQKYQEFKVPGDLPRDIFLLLYSAVGGSFPPSVPMIFFGDRYIGGYEDLIEFIDAHASTLI